MNLSEPFIRRPVMTAVLTVSAIVFGVLAYFALPVNDLPAVDYPVIQVSVGYPGATPETMANNVATPLERQFMQIPGLQLVTSNSGQGHSSFVLQFDLSKSVDAAATDVQAAIPRATAQLPVDLPSPPTFTKTNPNDQPIMYVGITSDSATQGQLFDYANTQVGERISILPGVSQVAVYGAQSAVRIKADPSAMAARSLTIDDLTAALKNGTSYTGAGQFDGAHHTFLLQPEGQLSEAGQYEDLIVRQGNGAPVYLKDVATVKNGLQDERISMRFWYRGHEVPAATVVVAVFRRGGSNAVEVAKSIRDLLPTVQAQLPSSVGIVPIYDRSQGIVNSVKDVQATLFIAFALVVLVIFIFLGRGRDTLIPVVALPLSLLLTFVVMGILGYSLDNLSLMALTLAPLMCSGLLQERGERAKKNWIERVIGGTEKKVLAVYGRSLWFFLRYRWISLAIWVVCLLGTVYLFSVVPKAFLPIGDSSFALGVFVAQEGTSHYEMHTHQMQVEEVLHTNPAVDMTFTMSGNNAFFPANQGLVLAFLKAPDKRPPIQVVTGQLMGQLNSKVPGLLTFLKPQPVLQISTGATAQLQGQFAYSISGIDPNEVYASAGTLMRKMSEFPGFLFVNSDLFNHTPNLQVDILREQSKTYGVSETRILNLLHQAYSQNYVYLIKKPTDQYQVILEVADDQRSEPQDLHLLYIKSDDGSRMVPLNALATWHPMLGPQSVNHINQFTSVTLFFNLKPGYSIGQATDFVEKTAKQVLPAGIRGEFQGEALTFRDTVSSLTILMFLAVFVMYVILAILYESYLHPITVLSSLPVALVGGLATLWLFHEQASLYAYVGMFLLMGIVKKNGIMIVDFALQRVHQGETAEKAIHDASMDRFRPIIMTTLAALMGAVPIALGYGADGASRRPLGLVVVGGLVVSQFITLFVTPAIYLYLEEFQEKVLDRFAFFRARHSRPVDAAVPGPATAD